MDKASLKKQCEQQEWLHQANPFWHLRIEKLQNHPLNTTECEHVFHEHQLGSDFYFVTPACVNFSQLSVPPVTLIYLGARRSGILATEADIPTLFVLSHNVLVCVRVPVLFYSAVGHVCMHTWERFSVCELLCGNLMLECKPTPYSCNGCGCIDVWEKAVYIVASTLFQWSW